jgi:S1-C subfamily serine protease
MPGLDDDAGDDDPVGPRPAPSERPWVHPAELQAFAPAPAAPPTPPRPREWVIGLVAAGAGVVVTVLLLVAFGALGGRERSAVPPPVVTIPNSPIDYGVAQRVAVGAGPSIVNVRTDRPGPDGRAEQGSGVVLRTDRVVTSAHFVIGATKIEVTTKAGETFTAQVIGIDPTTDLCLLSVEDVDPALPDPQLVTKPKIGDPVIAVGAGKGNEGWTDIGVVQEHNWVTSYADGAIAVPGLMATGTDTTPETSGGGLFDQNGRIIGILVSPPGATRHGLAVPIDVVLDVTDQLERRKSAEHGAIGVVFGDDAASKPRGATVVAVLPDGPAAKAEPPLQAGDVIVAAGNQVVRGWGDVVAVARRFQPTARLPLSIVRGNSDMRVSVTLARAGDVIWTEFGPLG